MHSKTVSGMILVLLIMGFLTPPFAHWLVEAEGTVNLEHKESFYVTTSTYDQSLLVGSVAGYSLNAGDVLFVSWEGSQVWHLSAPRMYLLTTYQFQGWQYSRKLIGLSPASRGWLMKVDSWDTTVNYSITLPDTYYVIIDNTNWDPSILPPSTQIIRYDAWFVRSITYFVHLESREDNSASNNNGSIGIDGVYYSLPQDASKEVGNHSIGYWASSGYVFVQWETSGSVSVSDPYQPDAVLTVGGSGSLTAVYQKVKIIWTVTPADFDTLYVQPGHYVDLALTIAVDPSSNSIWRRDNLGLGSFLGDDMDVLCLINQPFYPEINPGDTWIGPLYRCTVKATTPPGTVCTIAGCTLQIGCDAASPLAYYIPVKIVAGEPPPVTYSVHLESREDNSASNNKGNIVIGLYYALPDDAIIEAGNHSIGYAAVPGYKFVQWEASGAVSISDPHRPDAVLTVGGNGSVTAIYHKLTTLIWTVSPADFGTLYVQPGSSIDLVMTISVNSSSDTTWEGNNGGFGPWWGMFMDAVTLSPPSIDPGVSWTGPLVRITVNSTTPPGTVCTVPGCTLGVYSYVSWAEPQSYKIPVVIIAAGQPPTQNITINAHCNTEGIDLAVPITKDGSATGYTTPHTFNSLKGSHTFTVPGADANGHPFLQWSTGQTSTTITVSSGGTYTAYYQAAPPPTYDATISAHCNTEGVDVGVGIIMDGTSTGYATPHTFTGLTGSHTFTIPNSDSNGHPFKQWNTGQTTTTLTVTSGGIYTANYEAPPPPNYAVTVNAHCNTEGMDVSVAITKDGSSTGFSTPHTFLALTGSHAFTVPSTDNAGHPFLQWSTGQTSTTITVSSGGTFTAYYAEHAGFISVKSQYSGYFLKNLKFMNTFSVYTNISGTLPVQVYGILGGTQYTFSNSSNPGVPYTASVDMGSLQPGSSLAVSAVYSDGTVLNATYPLKIIETPSWLISLIKTATSTVIRVSNNTYTVHFAKDFDLPDKFNMNIPLPKFAGGGHFTLLPTISVEFTFSSDGNFSISYPLTYETPNMDFGAASVKAHVTLSASGNFALQNNTIKWLSATLSFEVGSSGSANVPIAGYTFHIPWDGDATIGLTATVSVDANFAASLVLAPTQNASQELISGLEIMIQSITGQIDFGLGLAINAGMGIASITGGGTIDFSVYLKPMQPYVSGGTVTGTVSIKYHVLWWTGTLWSMSGRLYEWGSDPYLNLGSISDFAIMPRYYNTTDYEGFVWPTGVWNGTAIQDVYPFTRMSASSNGDNAYILYTTNNISLPEQYGLSLTGLEFNSSQRTLKRLVMPSVSDEIFFNPVVISLPNGTLLAMWDSVPLSETSNATSPFEINRIIPQYSYFDTQTENWSPVRNLTETGVANSYQLSSDSTGSYALVLEADGIFSTSQHLVEYNVQSDSELLNMNVANVSNIISFNSLSHVAVLQLIDGSYELMNLSSRQLIVIPSMSGYSIKSVQLAVNSTDSLGILYSNSTSNVFSIYNVSSGTASFSMNVSQSTSYLTLIQTEPGYRLITSDSSGITSYLIANQIARPSVLYPMGNITFMGATITNDGVLVYATENYGNYSYPLLNLSLILLHTIRGDLDGNGKVNIVDIFIVARAFGSRFGDPNWDQVADLNNDGIVDILDIFAIARDYGKTV
jgi:hypothetical protein